jgi:D-amino-acid dehydrogenase
VNDKQVVVLGAGIVGISTALHLQRRGCAVTLVDKGPPGRETSYGNAGIIQREAVEPYGFPRDLASLMRVVTKRDIGVNYHLRAMPEYMPTLTRYWANSAPRHYRAIADAFRTLVEHSISEHSELIEQSAAQHLIVRKGWIQAFRTPEKYEKAMESAQRVSAHGVLSQALDGAGLRLAEPALGEALVGGIHWLQPWTCVDPGELVQRYAELFLREGGQFERGDARSLRQAGAGWRVSTESGPVEASQVVVALGPWAQELLRPMGYRIPLFIKRGYHAHFADGANLSRPVLDTEQGYMLAPMKRGVRLSTGAEFARLDAPLTPVQLGKAESAARQLLALGSQVERTPWSGARPCTVDMKPVIGAAPSHKGLWFNFGHAHQGFTLGPVSGRLLAELMMGETPVVEPAPFAPGRF